MTTFTKTGGVQSPRAAGGASQYTNHHAYLVLTDGTTTITIQDGAGGDTSYALKRQDWAPVIAGRRRSPLGGRTPIEDVVEGITITVRGTSAPDAYEKLTVLARLLEQAELWSMGENVSAVIAKFCPKGALVSSLVNPMQATILGRADGDETVGLDLTGEWNAAGTHFVIPEVRVRFKRRGLWLLNEVSAGSPVASNGDLVTLYLPPLRDAAPTRFSVTNVGWSQLSLNEYKSGFLLMGEDQDGVAPIYYAEPSAATISGYTSVADATGQASGNVLRYTPAGLGEVGSGTFSATLPAATNLVAVFANIRHSATVSFTVRLRLQSNLENQFTPHILIPANAALFPQWYFLGLVPKYGAITNLRLYVEPSAASSFLDIDTVVVADARTVQVLGIISPDDQTETISTLTVDHKLLELVAPFAAVGSNPVPYAGDAVLMSKASKIYAAWLATGGGSANGNRWRQTSTLDVLLPNAWTIYRRQGLLVPQ